MQSQVPDGVTIIEGFVEEATELFEALRANVIWDERMASRKTASFGVPYNYSQIRYPSAPFPQILDALGQQLHNFLGPRFNNCLLNLYSDGSGSMGFHSDDTSNLEPGSGVAIVSVGAERRITFRSKVGPTADLHRKLSNGSLLYMDGVVQRNWLHAIEQEEEVGPRISLTWRAFIE